MITHTARNHIIRALKQALRLPTSKVSEILDGIRNHNVLYLIGDRQVHTVKALVIDEGLKVALYINNGQGYEHLGVVFSLTAEQSENWRELPLEEAYAIAIEMPLPPM